MIIIREQIAALELRVAELSSLVEFHAARAAQATSDSESLASALQDLLCQPPPAALPTPNSISQEQLDRLSLANSALQEQLKEQRDRYPTMTN